MKDLDTHINGALRQSVFPNSHDVDFAPQSTLSAITRSSITETIWNKSKSFDALGETDKQLVRFTSDQAKEIFAIGIYINFKGRDLGKMMRRFMKLDKTDHNLPISDAEMEQVWPDDIGRRRSFRHSQNLFRAQYFSIRDRFSVIQLQPSVVLPIFKSKHVSQGQFGIVYKVKIHNEFLDDVDPIRKAGGVAAVKELRATIENADGKRAWEREVLALQRICQLGLRHVVGTTAMFSIDKKQYFIFPWADRGNLIDLWKHHDSHHSRSSITRRHIPNIMSQLVGIADALARLHDFQYGNAASYRHGDLKPENILIFGSDKHNFLGVWKLADLGLARYHIAATGDRVYVSSNSGAGTISFQPPESLKAGAAPTSRSYDIWSMGCIILQLITWLIYGTRGKDELTKNTISVKGESSYWTAAYAEGRAYYNIRVHPAVEEHMAEMKRLLQGSQALQDLLCLVEDKLLVVRLPHQAATLESGCRTNAADLYRSLQAIEARCQQSEYWLPREDIVKQM